MLIPDVVCRAPAFFSFASNVFNGLGAFFCNFGQHRNLCRCFGASAGVAPGQPRARVPHLVGSMLPRPCHFPAGIQSFQAVAAPFPGDSVLPRALAPRSRRPKRLGSRSVSTFAIRYSPFASYQDVQSFRVIRNYHDTLWYFRKEKSSNFQTATTSRSARDATHPEASTRGKRLRSRVSVQRRDAPISIRIRHHRVKILNRLRQEIQPPQRLALGPDHQDAPIAHASPSTKEHDPAPRSPHQPNAGRGSVPV